ncbi:MAG: hypothetical protein AAF327_22875 [Cyanobacteria bacterium P01_A01_bin.37]
MAKQTVNAENKPHLQALKNPLEIAASIQVRQTCELGKQRFRTFPFWQK